MKRIAVLMTCYNRVQTTLTCLRLLYGQEMSGEYDIDVWLVDDASPDGTGNAVKKRFPRVNVIKSNGNLFWSKGMRLAWDAAAAAFDYDYYLWLNDDVLLKSKALPIVLGDLEKIETSPWVVLAGAVSSDETETDISYGATKFFPVGSVPRRANGYLNGNLVLVPREVFKKVGPICGRYHHGYGDYDYGLMLRRAGIGIYSSSQILGVCPQQPERYVHLKGKRFPERVRALFDPKGYSLHDAFVYRYRNWGLVRALMSSAHIMIKICLGAG